MAGFLRKKATLSKTKPPPVPPTRTDDAPPSLPPLILSASLADPDPAPPRPLPAAACPPPLPPAPEPSDDHWDPWKTFAQPAPPSAANASVLVPSTQPRPVATASSPPPQHPVAHPCASPAVVRGQTAPHANFDFEESLSAANVTSVVNQFRSYPPPIRHHTSPAQPSHLAVHPPLSSTPHRNPISPQKPGSSSSLSSSSHHTDATRRTDGSHGTSTSASSLPPAAENLSNALRSNVAHIRSSSTDSLLPLASLSASRPFTTANVTSRVAHRSPTAPSVPPTSYTDRTRNAPMVFDLQRSGNPDMRRGPLIFAAMASALNGKHHANGNTRNPYPSPPAEYASLEASPAARRSSLTPSLSRSPPQVELRLPQGLAVSPPFQSTELPALSRKSSKNSLGRVGVERSLSGTRGDDPSRHRVLTKARPSTPQKPSTAHRVLPAPGDPLLLDEDPFARVQGVRVVQPRARSPSMSSSSHCATKEDGFSNDDGHTKQGTAPPVPKAPLTPPSSNDACVGPDPDDYKTARQQRRGQWLEKAPPPAVAEVAKQLLEEAEQPEEPREPTPPPTYFPIMAFMSDAHLLPLLLSYLSYSEWLALYSTNKQVRGLFQSRILREFVLERYLSTIGYSKWTFEWAEPLELSLKDLHNYLRGVAMPAHQYARLSAEYLHSTAKEGADAPDILALALTTRSYTRVLLRLRAQAESEAKYLQTRHSVDQASGSGTRQPSVSSRAPSPTSSHSHSRHHSRGKNEHSSSSASSLTTTLRFRSPLYRPGRAPVLRVFVPSPDGEWLSDASVVECEAELKRSGILKLLRVGDIVWDVAVGDEGNLGRLIWDGSYLVDLDYRYSRVGELSPYFHSLAFSPSYFHRVVRIGGSATHNPHCNPIVYVDVSPWGREIAANLQLLQDRARTETPHGAMHDVVRWVHRSTFTIRPPVSTHSGQHQSRLRNLRIPIPKTEGYYIDPGWYGTVVLESEGTNEGLADLQGRCGPGVFPPRAETLATKIRNEKEKENKRVWRILREKSRPGELWLRAVQVEERLM